ncbi:MAG: dihydropteroate synthase [Actinobacteria bacterium]|nr:dihydropteroate synthase [Actinomycetota bacterium]
MGILNVTPDSFSDGGRHESASAIRARMRECAASGATICDVGAESTRPGAQPVDVAEELRRLAPAFGAMRDAAIAISIDTSKALVAREAISVGAVLVNDVTAGRGDPDLLPLVADTGVAVCLMHMRGTPTTMQNRPHYRDVVDEVTRELADRAEAAIATGIAPDRILVDPGIGFGKTLAHNLSLLAGIGRIGALGYPVVVGVSRKGMFGELLGRPIDERLPGSIAGALAAVSRGASVIRVHDVRATVDALRTWTAIQGVT